MKIKCDLCSSFFEVRKRIASYYYTDIQVEWMRHLITKCKSKEWEIEK